MKIYGRIEVTRDDPHALSKIMDFDHVITVREDGTVTDGPSSLWAPECLDSDGTLSQHPDHNGWSLIGHSGAYGYSGPVMNPAEYIGGRLADLILSQPGHYVALVVPGEPDDDESTGENDDASCPCGVAHTIAEHGYDPDNEDDPEPSGWAVAYRPL